MQQTCLAATLFIQSPQFKTPLAKGSLGKHHSTRRTLFFCEGLKR